jgi:hypothetical protein
MANEIIRELTKGIFNQDSSYESIGVKNVAEFMKYLSKQSTKVVYQNISSLLAFFDCESYYLRISLIKILANIIRNVLTKETDDAKTQQIYN